LEEYIANGAFRADIFYRLRQFSITMPPLRERIEDVPLLARHFLEQVAEKLDRDDLRISEEVLPHLLRHPWPGNVRELKSLIGQIALLEDPCDIADLLGVAAPGERGNGKHDNLRSSEIRTLLGALSAAKWNRKKAAVALGLSYSSLRRRIDKYNLDQYQLQWSGELDTDHTQDAEK
jgi:transcriptional regulator with PAS, ATPase and Fis domain